MLDRIRGAFRSNGGLNWAAIAGLVIAVAAGTAWFMSPGAAVTAIDGPGVIDKPGRYVVARDVDVAFEDTSTEMEFLIEIDASDVTLDLDGHTLICSEPNGDNAATGGILLENGHSATVTNGTISGCDTGINARGAGSLTVRNVAFAGVRTVGVYADLNDLVVTGSSFSDIAGYTKEAYAVGVSASSAKSCRIERNAFSEIYRQANVLEDMTGEGVGVILGSRVENCVLAQNTLVNLTRQPNTTGFWIAQGARAAVAENMIAGFVRGVVGLGKVEARNSAIWVEPGGGNETYGIFATEGSTMSGNLIIGFQQTQGVLTAEGKYIPIE